MEGQNYTTSEKLEMLKLYQEDFLFRHTIYWNLFYKTIGAILGLLALPITLYEILDNKSLLLAIFPFAAVILCFCSFLLMQTENARMKASKYRLNKIGKDLPNLYMELNIDKALDEEKSQKEKLTYREFLKCPVSKKMNFLYVVFLVAGLVEGLFIFFSFPCK